MKKYTFILLAMLLALLGSQTSYAYEDDSSWYKDGDETVTYYDGNGTWYSGKDAEPFFEKRAKRLAKNKVQQKKYVAKEKPPAKKDLTPNEEKVSKYVIKRHRPTYNTYNLALEEELVIVRKVNKDVNKAIRYSSDRRGSDVWQTPEYTKKTGAGDCEDIAILKYYTLREEGIPYEKLRITYTKKHMVLAYIAKNGRVAILDGKTNRIIWKNMYQYKKIATYGFNGDKFELRGIPYGDAVQIKKWLHIMAQTNPKYYSS